MDSPPSNRAHLLSRALEDRLAEVRGRRAALAGTRPAGPAPPACPSGDVEETLRVAMTRLWPRARSAPGPRDWLALFDALHRLEAAARSEDWRFLDAWNNAFEAFDPAACTDSLRQPAVAFLDTYAALLASHLSRLRGRP